MAMKGEQSFAAFWPVYVRAHSEWTTRLMHCVGTLVGWGILAAAIALREWWWIGLAVVLPFFHRAQ
jgi:hypothetical protein